MKKYYTLKELYSLAHNGQKEILVKAFPEVVNSNMYLGEIVDTIAQWQLKNIHLFRKGK